MTDVLRVAFVGRAGEVGHAVPAAPVDGLQPLFVEQRAGASPARLLAHVAEHAPHVVVVFGVDSIPATLARAFDVPVLAWTAAPDRPPGLEHHPELSAAFVPERAGPADYVTVIDRPLPVADEHFAAPRRPPGPPRALVIGHSSPRSELLLIDSKHRHELLHIASGLRGDPLAAMLASAVVAINARDDDAPGFGPRVALYLAAGLLLVTEPLHPPHGLRPGIDHIEIRSSDELLELLGRVRANPDDFTAIREAGRRQAEAFRASRVYRQVLAPFVTT